MAGHAQALSLVMDVWLCRFFFVRALLAAVYSGVLERCSVHANHVHLLFTECSRHAVHVHLLLTPCSCHIYVAALLRQTQYIKGSGIALEPVPMFDKAIGKRVHNARQVKATFNFSRDRCPNQRPVRNCHLVERSLD